MSTTIHKIEKASDLQFALRGVRPDTPIEFNKDIGDIFSADCLVCELMWSVSPQNAHFIRIGPGGKVTE